MTPKLEDRNKSKLYQKDALSSPTRQLIFK